METDEFIFHGSPKPFDENVVEETTFAIDQDANARPAQLIRSDKRRELTALVHIHDLWRTKFIDRFAKRTNA